MASRPRLKAPVSSDPAVASDSLARRLTVPPPPTSFATSPHPTYPTRPQNQLAQAARAWRRPQSALSQLWRVCGRHGACVASTSCVPPLAPHTFPFSQTPTVAASSLVRAPPPPAHFYLRLLSASSGGIYLSPLPYVAAAAAAVLNRVLGMVSKADFPSRLDTHFVGVPLDRREIGRAHV